MRRRELEACRKHLAYRSDLPSLVFYQHRAYCRLSEAGFFKTLARLLV